MEDKYSYRLTKVQKHAIAQNLIDILERDTHMSKDTRRFIGDWLLTGPDEKRKAFFDVWDIVLENYMPTTRPILFRSCGRISSKRKVASFTGRLECARRIGRGEGFLVICDTNEALSSAELAVEGTRFRHTFYPLVDVLAKARDVEGRGFSEGALEFIGEDEYIMRMDLTFMHAFKCVKNKY